MIRTNLRISQDCAKHPTPYLNRFGENLVSGFSTTLGVAITKAVRVRILSDWYVCYHIVSNYFFSSLMHIFHLEFVTVLKINAVCLKSIHQIYENLLDFKTFFESIF